MSTIIYITSIRDLKTYVDERLGANATEQDICFVTDYLWARGPAHDDWSDFLGAIPCLWDIANKRTEETT